MTDDEYLDAVRRARAESVLFFSSANRRERELWVAREFLVNLAIPHADEDLKWMEHDPPDVCFGQGCFEIKEILDPERRRHAEYKEALVQAEAATDPADLLEQFTPRDATILEIVQLVQTRAVELATEKYPLAMIKTLDLHVNLEDVFGLDEDPVPDTEGLAQLGWRSVSFLMGHRSCVLTADWSAPSFLRNAVGRIVHRAHGEE